ncbi:MAG: hypothetical protein CMN76_10325 [Spirochaetaceae bacterium]|nr:hypothetical protein [Spirochaetaceae bacterium]
MSAGELQYFKFITDVIRSGTWARLSSAARALYPVLLSFTDRHFSPVYPGSNRLLELTGFKQKSSLRKAREELQEAGLILVKKGSGRTNSTYHFIFTPQESATVSPGGTHQHTPAGDQQAPQPATSAPPRAPLAEGPYNQIHISIQNQTDAVPRQSDASWERARNECLMAGIPPTNENVQKILSREQGNGPMAWDQILSKLRGRMSESSLRLLEASYLGEQEGWIRLGDSVPEYLKTILLQISNQILFEPEQGSGFSTERHRHWNQLI